MVYPRQAHPILLIGVVGALSACSPSPPNTSAASAAGGRHDHTPSAASPVPDRARLAAIKQATARFQTRDAALAEGYAQFRGCFNNPGVGAMGVHFANQSLIDDPAIDPLRPELLVYEPRADGTFELVALEYFVVRSAWHATGERELPALLDRRFEPGELDGLPPYYALHVWLWRDNPLGTFAPWNPAVSCT
ncbi:MAG TPA: hypothetical protein VJ596_01210 [Gemmatimonadaceae bacterium]|nr:hypothetical protein [Gemmatimonadaceae bacterium]